MIAPARIAAYETLLAVTAGRMDLPSALARARKALPDERDRKLAGEIATGTLRWQAALDRVIETYAQRGASRLDREVLTILRLGAFQLLHLDRVPASAVVDDAVELAKRVRKRSASGLINALLRRVSRERRRLPLPSRPADLSDRAAVIEYASVSLSHPEWLIARWHDRHGAEAAIAWAEFNNRPAPLTLRANTLRTTREALASRLAAAGVETEPAARAPHGLVVRAGNPLLTPVAGTGLFVVQDEASQLVGAFVEARPGERVLDTCASPGGKTTQMAADMEDRGTIVAADVRPRRVELLVRGVAESGSRIIRVVHADAAMALPVPAVFDAVLVDAPCSGLGTLRRDPDIKWRRTPDELLVLAARQRQMLEHAAAAVRPGGRVVYSTCSSEPEENEEVVEALLAGHPAFARDRADLRTSPFRDGLEAFFAARLVRSSA